MKAICKNGFVIDCGNFTAIDGGVLLTEDEKRKRVMGFVPTGELQYVVPDEIADDAENVDEYVPSNEAATEGTDRVAPAEDERAVTRLRDRLDRLEAALELSRTAIDGEPTRDAAEPIDGEPSEPEARTETGDAETAADHGAGEPDDTDTADDTDDGTDEVDASAVIGRSDPTTDDGSGTETETDSGTDIGTEAEAGASERLATTGFDPVAVVAKRAHEEESSGTSVSGDDRDGGTTGDETIGFRRTDPVATVAEQYERAAEDTPSTDGIDTNVTTGGDSEAAAEPDDMDLQRIDGLGPTYASRLREDGIETVADLRGTDVTTIAATAQLGEARAENWIEQAEQL
jgi:predicted flap endonuclease-1-like 5' DNA nuclease